MCNTLVLVKGCSGAGKSSRVGYVVEQLSLVADPQDILYKGEPVGKLFSSPNMKGSVAILGKSLINQKWQGLDSVTRRMGTSDDITDFVVEYLSLNKNTTLIVEGAGTTLSWRWRPNYLNSINVNNLFSLCRIIYYQFPLSGYDDYCSRICSRSGKPPSSMAMWRKNKSFIKECQKSIVEMDNLPTEDVDKFEVLEYTFEYPKNHLFEMLVGSSI